MKIEGLARNVGTHAAAVVIADRPLTDYVPLCRVSGKEDVITQWSMNDVEAAGLLKMDFLGLRNLTILRIAVDLIEQTTGERIDPLKFPLDDAETFALLCRGETKGVFQLESGGIRDLLQKMKPDRFTTLSPPMPSTAPARWKAAWSMTTSKSSMDVSSPNTSIRC